MNRRDFFRAVGIPVLGLPFVKLLGLSKKEQQFSDVRAVWIDENKAKWYAGNCPRCKKQTFYFQINPNAKDIEKHPEDFFPNSFCNSCGLTHQEFLNTLSIPDETAYKTHLSQ